MDKVNRGRRGMRAALLGAGVLILSSGLAGAAGAQTWQENSRLGYEAYGKGDFAAAETRLVAAASALERSGRRGRALATLYNDLGLTYFRMARYEEAEDMHRTALEMRESLLGEEHPDVAQTLNDLAFLLSAQGKYAQAAPLYDRALAIRKEKLGKDSTAFAASLNNKAQLLADLDIIQHG